MQNELHRQLGLNNQRSLNNGKWIASPEEAAGTISLHRECSSTRLSLHRIGMDRAAIVFNQVEELAREVYM
jgi:hypothetical protein